MSRAPAEGNMSNIKNVTLQFSDGICKSVAVKDGESVLDAALAADLQLIHQCRSGSCSCCMATLTEGNAKMRSGSSSTLLRSEFEAGQRLLCLAEPESDCTFALNYDSNASLQQATKVRAFIDDVEKLAHNVVRLTLELAEGEWLDFRPGQFVQVKVPGLSVMRSYSPASTSADLPKIVLLIRLLPDGAMSNYLRSEAARDAVLELEGPFGSFFLREKVKAPHIMIAGGTGLAPVMSMIDSIQKTSGKKPPILLSFGCATPDSLFCLDDIELRKHWLPSLTNRISVDREAAGSLLQGNPVDALRDDDVKDPDTVAYICGPQPMIEAAYRRLEALGVRHENIFAEQFTPSN
uniref:Oxidoreductase FAD/NAD(P)-binding:Oxidoreductase FAD-binding region n=1 Tax=Dechloromonas aromatica (strain RCB) TaxID=159087 RepID=Q47GC3_DECAR